MQVSLLNLVSFGERSFFQRLGTEREIASSSRSIAPMTCEGIPLAKIASAPFGPIPETVISFLKSSRCSSV